VDLIHLFPSREFFFILENFRESRDGQHLKHPCARMRCNPCIQNLPSPVTEPREGFRKERLGEANCGIAHVGCPLNYNFCE